MDDGPVALCRATILRAATVIVILSTTGCLSLLEGQAVAPGARAIQQEERAVLLGRSQWFLVYALDISIWSIDGLVEAGVGLRRAEVAPGHHRITIENFIMFGGMGGTTRHDFELEARAGHEYQVRWVQPGNGCTVEIAVRTPGSREVTTERIPCT